MCDVSLGIPKKNSLFIYFFDANCLILLNGSGINAIYKRETRVPALLKVPKMLFTFKAPFLNWEMNKRVRKNYPFCDFETAVTEFVS
jgi:hypothetical protein